MNSATPTTDPRGPLLPPRAHYAVNRVGLLLVLALALHAARPYGAGAWPLVPSVVVLAGLVLHRRALAQAVRCVFRHPHGARQSGCVRGAGATDVAYLTGCATCAYFYLARPTLGDQGDFFAAAVSIIAALLIAIGIEAGRVLQCASAEEEAFHRLALAYVSLGGAAALVGLISGTPRWLQVVAFIYVASGLAGAFTAFLGLTTGRPAARNPGGWGVTAAECRPRRARRRGPRT